MRLSHFCLRTVFRYVGLLSDVKVVLEASFENSFRMVVSENVCKYKVGNL